MAAHVSSWLLCGAIYLFAFPLLTNGDLSTDNDNMIIIVSDGGSDDAVAIMQVLKEDSANLLAITCTYGNVVLEQACDNILRTLNLLGLAEEVPLYKGSAQPITGTAYFDGYFGPDGFGNASSQFPLPNVKARNEPAAIAIVSLINMYPGRITLISLGPLTDLALAVMLDPTIPSKIKQLTIMGGSATANGNASPVAEFNMADDAVAASVVINAYPAGCIVTIMTWDMCSQYSPSWDWYNYWISPNTTEAYFISQIMGIANAANVANNETFQCCDLQATTAVLYPEVINQTDSEYVQVEVCGSLTKGELIVDYRTPPSQPPNIEFYSALNEYVMMDIWDDITGAGPNNDTSTTSSEFPTDSTFGNYSSTLSEDFNSTTEENDNSTTIGYNGTTGLF